MNNYLHNLKALAASIVLVFCSFGAEAADTRPVTTVVELFTSQGCSSCPPADKLIERLSSRDDLVVLSLSVDYWDYLGWKDTFGSPENSDRQRAYALARNDGSVYTPQVVLNGVSHLVGHNESGINRFISKSQSLPVELELAANEDFIDISIEGILPKGIGHAAIILAGVNREKTVFVQKGENRGRKITYSNIVRRMQSVGNWNGEPHRFQYPLNEIAIDDSDAVAVLVQIYDLDRPGIILGAGITDVARIN